FAEAEYIAIELGDVLDVGDEKRDVAELVRNNAFSRKTLAREGVPLEYFHYGSLRILEPDHVRNRGFGVFPALGFNAVALNLLLEVAEVVLRSDLEAEPHALCLRSLAQHHGVVIKRRSKIHRILVLIRRRETDDLGVVLALLVDIRNFVNGVGDLLDADHADLRTGYLRSTLVLGGRQRADHIDHRGDILLPETHFH